MQQFSQVHKIGQPPLAILELQHSDQCTLLSQQLAKSQVAMAAIGIRNAQARLAGFLLMIGSAMERLGYSGSRFVLPMRRLEVASYLGTSLETVSRSMTSLASQRLIEVDRREITVVDSAGLREVQQMERDTSGMAMHKVPIASAGRTRRVAPRTPWSTLTTRPSTAGAWI